MKKRVFNAIVAAVISLSMHVFAVGVLTKPPVNAVQAATPARQIFKVHVLSLPTPSVMEGRPVESSLSISKIDGGNNQRAAIDDQFSSFAFQEGPTTRNSILEWAEIFPQWSSATLPMLQLFPVDEMGSYLRSDELDVRPRPTAPVVIPFPNASLNRRKASAILTLYIGIQGKIEHIEFNRSDLPPAFEQAARASFMSAKMLPGIKDGHPVPARMKIEVEFEAR